MTFIVDLTLKPSELQGKVVDDVDDFDSETDAKTAEGILLKLNTRKARSPDNICGRLLKLCTSQLSVVFSQLFTWSERKCCTLYLENLCNLSGSRK